MFAVSVSFYGRAIGEVERRVQLRVSREQYDKLMDHLTRLEWKNELKTEDEVFAEGLLAKLDAEAS